MPLSRIALRFMPAPSSDTSTTTSEPSRCSAMVIVPLSFLPAFLRSSGVSMPCATALRSMCSNGGIMRSSTWRSSSPEAPSICELGLLVRVGRRLAHDAREALHVALERHHARAHEAVLQFGDGARLLGQQVLRVLGEVLEQLLDAADVVGGFGEAARELLDRGIAVELERIEFAASARPLLRSDAGSALRSRARACAAVPSGA